MYHYAGNNPIKYTDPDGRSPELWRIFFTPDSNSWERVIRHEVRKDEVKFAQTFNFIQNESIKLGKITVNGLLCCTKFMSDHGSEIALLCYASGFVQIGIVIDGVTLFCDITNSFVDLYKTGDLKQFGYSVSKIILLQASGTILEASGKAVLKNLQKDFTKQIVVNEEGIVKAISSMGTLLSEKVINYSAQSELGLFYKS